MATIAQQLKNEGIEQGKIEIAERLLSRKTELANNNLIEWVHRMTGLPVENVQMNFCSRLEKRN